MKKILLSALLLLSVATAKPMGLGDALKYARDLNALNQALKGDPQGFATLIDSAKVRLGDINFKELGSRHIQNIINLAKTGMNDENSQIRLAAKVFAEKLIQELASENMAKFLPLIKQLQGLVAKVQDSVGKGLPSHLPLLKM